MDSGDVDNQGSCSLGTAPSQFPKSISVPEYLRRLTILRSLFTHVYASIQCTARVARKAIGVPFIWPCLVLPLATDSLPASHKVQWLVG